MKMLAPALGAGIEERNKLARQRIIGTDIWTLVAVASKTRQCEIVCYSGAAMLDGHNMVRFMAVGSQVLM